VPDYALYLESGPKRQKTLVHVLDLLGCVANGPTTDAALAATPDAIRAYLHFLRRHGAEAADPEGEVRTHVAEHITEGIWLGNGDPSITFQPDLAPLSAEQVERYIQRLEWSRAEVVELVRALDAAQSDVKPEAGGRAITAILEHMLESEYNYMQAFGKIEGLPGAGAIVSKRQGDLLSWMALVRAREIERLRELTPEQRSEPFIHWKYTRTGRKILRRMLEHEWEHLQELRTRLGQPG
jgi:uncharacterized damage-inducible protein DinB/predicted RNase H-like HicB family nuclease